MTTYVPFFSTPQGRQQFRAISSLLEQRGTTAPVRLNSAIEPRDTDIGVKLSDVDIEVIWQLHSSHGVRLRQKGECLEAVFA